VAPALTTHIKSTTDANLEARSAREPPGELRLSVGTGRPGPVHLGRTARRVCADVFRVL